MVAIGAIGYFMPIFAFLLVFLVVYALLKKTEVLRGSEPVILFISFILASFFIVQASLVEFIRFSSAWFSVLVLIVFFIVLLISFVPEIKAGEFFNKNSWLAWAILGGIVALFIISSAYVFNWVVNWDMVGEWVHTDWFGMILLVIIAAVVSLKIKG